MSDAPHVQATVVRAQRPTSVRPGAHATIHPDGRIEGFVGGTCAQESVRLHALRVLETGEPLLLRIRAGDPAQEAAEGTVTVNNPCLSGGALEIFLEPRLPPARLRLVGDTPIAAALAAVASAAGFAVERSGAVDGGEDAVVVASHGRDEEAVLDAALRAHVPYVGLVASRRRGAAVLEALDVDTTGVHTPAGLDIGARTAPEVAVSIVAEIIQARREVLVGPPVEAAVDPVCGMAVVASAQTPSLEVDGRTLYFCCDGCRSAFEAHV